MAKTDGTSEFLGITGPLATMQPCREFHDILGQQANLRGVFRPPVGPKANMIAAY